MYIRSSVIGIYTITHFFHSSDDIDYRGSTTTLYQPSTSAYSANQVHPLSSLPWLGSGQTSTGASVVCYLLLGMGSGYGLPQNKSMSL